MFKNDPYLTKIFPSRKRPAGIPTTRTAGKPRLRNTGLPREEWWTAARRTAGRMGPQGGQGGQQSGWDTLNNQDGNSLNGGAHLKASKGNKEIADGNEYVFFSTNLNINC